MYFSRETAQKKADDFIRINKNLKINILLTKINFFRLVYTVATRGACAARLGFGACAARFWSMRSEARSMRSIWACAARFLKCAARSAHAQRGWSKRSEVGACAARLEEAQRGRSMRSEVLKNENYKSALPPRYRHWFIVGEPHMKTVWVYDRENTGLDQRERLGEEWR